MKQFIAVVSHDAGTITKYADFDTQAEADAHVAEFGGFATLSVEGDFEFITVDDVAKTLTHDPIANDAAIALNIWLSAMTETDHDIPRALEDLYDVMSATQQAKVAKKTRDKIIAKKELRGTKP